MNSSAKRCLSRDAYTVALLCPSDIELSSIRCMMDDEHEQLPAIPGDSNQYIYGQLSGHNVVVASLPAGYRGKVSAAVVASHISRSFPSVKLRMLVGIGGGIPSVNNDIRLGDVVISTPSGTQGGVIEYDLGKNTLSGFERKGLLCPPPTEWLAALKYMQSDHRIYGSKIPRFIDDMLRNSPQLSKYCRPPEWADLLFVSDYVHQSEKSTCSDCDKSQMVTRPMRKNPNVPKIHYGLIASGDQAIESASERDRLGKSHDNVICFETEAAGLMNNFRCIVIRGISHYADSHKNDVWQLYAALAAAGAAKELLCYIHPTPGEMSTAAPMDVFEALKNSYMSQDRLQILRLSGERLSMESCYINLNIIRNSQGRPQFLDEDTKSRHWPVKRGKISTTNMPLSLEKLFHPLEDENGNLKLVKRILIQGHAGVGKTTLCKKIVHDFLKHNMWHDEIDWVVWIPLSRLKQSPDRATYSLGDFFYEEYFSHYPDGKSLAQKAWEMIEGTKYLHRCLFILDGLDEVWHKWETGKTMNRFLHHILEMPRLIVTSRPYSSEQHCVKYIDLEVEAIGFKK